MKDYFSVVQIMDGVKHIGDRMHVYATLVEGSKKALLFDTTNGIGNLREQVERLTDKPYRVIASHGHGDHTRGNYQFENVWLHPADFEICSDWNQPEEREAAYERARKAGLVPDGFDGEAFKRGGTGNLLPLNMDEVFDLGGLTVKIVPMRGHTPGQIGLLLCEKRLLLTSDACNPMMWMFLKGATSIPQWARMLRRVKELPFDYFLPAHIPTLLPKSRFDIYLETAAKIDPEKSVPMKHPPAYRCQGPVYVFSLGPVTGEEQLEDTDFTAIYYTIPQLVDDEA